MVGHDPTTRSKQNSDAEMEKDTRPTRTSPSNPWAPWPGARPFFPSLVQARQVHEERAAVLEPGSLAEQEMLNHKPAHLIFHVTHVNVTSLTSSTNTGGRW